VGIVRGLKKRNAFYGDSLTESERKMLPAARKLEGLEEEIATLRVKLQSAMKEKEFDFRLFTHGIDMLVKAVATQYRLSPKARKDLADNIGAVLNSLGDQLLPAGG
jgi:hypothetical protein